MSSEIERPKKLLASEKTMNIDTHDSNQSLNEPLLSARSARARAAILKALDELGEPAGALKISEMIGGTGIPLQERTIRFHLLKMDREGLTHCVGKHEGRAITADGKKELARLSVLRKVGFIGSKMDELGYRMTFDIRSATGSVVSNIAMIRHIDLSRSLHHMKPVFSSGLSMGNRVAVALGGGKICDTAVPRGKTAISTICSVTMNGVFLKAGIPVVSRFGGLLEMNNGSPRRFLELIEYQGTSIDPHKMFILANMTNVSCYAAEGSGIIGVSFREFPSVAVDAAKKLIAAMRESNLNGVLAMGRPNCPLLDIPVREGRTGLITIDGLNPIAALHEAGIPVEFAPLSGLEDIDAYAAFEDIAPMGRRSVYVE
jgi:HTH-type transcriptional regulator, global nitrogen regulator NrpRI